MSHTFNSFCLITVRTCGEEFQTMSYYRMPRKLIFSSVIPNWNKWNILISYSRKKKETHFESLEHAVFMKYCRCNKGSTLQNKYVLNITTLPLSPKLQVHCVQNERDIDPPSISEESLCLQEAWQSVSEYVGAFNEQKSEVQIIGLFRE